jgi:hypothetical protein
MTENQIVSYNSYKAKFLDSLPHFVSVTGVLTQKDGDTGDSCQRMGTVWTLYRLLGDSLVAQSYDFRFLVDDVSVLKASWGYYRRSNVSTFWGYDPRCTSRDQLSVMKMALSFKELLLTFVRQTLRLGFHQNYYDPQSNKYQVPDFPILSELSVYARGLLGPASYLITWVTDLGYAVDLLLRNYNDLNVWSEDNMLAVGLLHACHKHPSITAKIIMYFYKRTDFMQRLEKYHGVDNGNNGCLPLLYLFKMAFLKLERFGD